MGKATIVNHLGEARYTVDVHRYNTRISDDILRLQQLIAMLQQELAAAELEKDQAEIDFRDKRAVLDAAIIDYNAATTEEERRSAWKAINAAEAASLPAAQALAEANGAVAVLSLRLRIHQKRIETLQPAADATTTRTTAWCADLNEELTGEVGTIEVVRAGTIAELQIYPGGEAGTGAAWSESRDGELQSTLGGTPESNFVNYALAPGADKWRRRYRYGTILSIVDDSCTVELDNVAVGHQNLPVNLAVDEQVTATIRYMSCDGRAFDVGDVVIVAFEGATNDQPVVIGFRSEPQPCNGLAIFTRHAFVGAFGLYATKPDYELTEYVGEVIDAPLEQAVFAQQNSLVSRVKRFYYYGYRWFEYRQDPQGGTYQYNRLQIIKSRIDSTDKVALFTLDWNDDVAPAFPGTVLPGNYYRQSEIATTDDGVVFWFTYKHATGAATQTHYLVRYDSSDGTLTHSDPLWTGISDGQLFVQSLFVRGDYLFTAENLISGETIVGAQLVCRDKVTFDVVWQRVLTGRYLSVNGVLHVAEDGVAYVITFVPAGDGRHVFGLYAVTEGEATLLYSYQKVSDGDIEYPRAIAAGDKPAGEETQNRVYFVQYVNLTTLRIHEVAEGLIVNTQVLTVDSGTTMVVLNMLA